MPMSDGATIPIDVDARNRAVGSDESVLVQAPAGSGKTTLLTQRYLRLLSRVDAPERILALTFTRRAAQEMRERVLAALRAADEPQAPSHIGSASWLLAVAAKHHLAALHIDLASQPSRVRIETIDAFNAWLAGQLPIAAGMGAGLKVLTDPRSAYEEAARRTLAHVDDDIFGIAVESVLALDDQRWRALVKLIADMLPSRDRWLPLLAGRLNVVAALDQEQLARVRRHFDEDLRLLVSRVLRRAHEALGAERLSALSPLMCGAASHLTGRHPEWEEWLRDATPLRADASDLARWRRIANLLLTKDGAWRARLTKTEGFPQGSVHKAAMLALMQEFERDPRILRLFCEVRTLPMAAYSDEQWGRVREVAQVLVLAAAQLDSLFREQGAVDFPAISIAALRALDTDDAPTDLSLRLDYRLQHILLDEFQDTSSAQLELIRLLTAGWLRGDGRSVFCVGDPMQSIYGFRQAEVRAFLELAEQGIGQVHFDLQRLRSNFRSNEFLVAWINDCFSQIMPAADDRDRGAIAFRPSTAMIAKTEGEATAVLAQGFESRAAESNAVADMIAAALQTHPDWRIAVLLRAKTHAREIVAGLRNRDIGFHALDIEPLQDRAIVRDIIMLTRALLHLGDRIAWMAVLRAPWAGLSLADLRLLGCATPLPWHALTEDAVLDRLSTDGRARSRRLRETLQAAFRVRSHTSVARWIESTWLCLGGPSVAGSAEQLELARTAFSRLQALEESGLPDPSELAQSFATLFADHGAAAAVEIMTIHKAKGLEFDMVVLPALDRHVPNNRDLLLLSHQFARSGRDGMVMAARPPIGADSDALFEFLRGQVRDAGMLEAQRLLYVACTRAKCRLRLTANIGPAESDTDTDEAPTSPEFRPRAGSLLSVLWPVVGAQFRATAAPPFPSTQRPHARPEPIIDEVRLTRVPADWTSVWDMVPIGTDAIATALAPKEDVPIFDWAGETARRIGSLVHAELQSMDLPNIDAQKVRARRIVFERWLTVHGVPEARLADAATRVVDALIAVQADPKGRWMLKSGYRDDFREYAVSGLHDGEIVRAIFDRSFIDEGTRWVIDYKTSQHTGSGLEEFLDREVERYAPQLKRYARLARRLGPEPVRVGLYFPLMRAWREMPAD